jgi:hypothetical protein
MTVSTWLAAVVYSAVSASDSADATTTNNIYNTQQYMR